MCFYHSIMDWHEPDYLPRRDWEKNRSSEGAVFSRPMLDQMMDLATSGNDALAKLQLAAIEKAGVRWADLLLPT